MSAVIRWKSAVWLAAAVVLSGACSEQKGRPPPPPIGNLDGSVETDSGPELVICEDEGAPSRSGLASDLRLDEMTSEDIETFCTWAYYLYGDGIQCDDGTTHLFDSNCQTVIMDGSSVECAVTSCDIEACSIDGACKPTDPDDPERPASCAAWDDCYYRATH